MPYNMQLPKLETGGTDISNTLQNIYKMRKQEEANTIANRRLDISEQNTNALQVHRANTERRQATAQEAIASKEDIPRYITSMAYISALPPEKQEEAYVDFCTTAGKSGRQPPGGFLHPDTFKENGVWNPTAVKSYAASLQDAVKGMAGDKNIQVISNTEANPEYDPSKPLSMDNSPAHIKKYKREGKKFVPIEELPGTPATTSIQSGERSEEASNRAAKKAAAGPQPSKGTWVKQGKDENGYDVFYNPTTKETRVSPTKVVPTGKNKRTATGIIGSTAPAQTPPAPGAAPVAAPVTAPRATPPKVGETRALPDGRTLQVMPNGKLKVTDVKGNVTYEDL